MSDDVADRDHLPDPPPHRPGATTPDKDAERAPKAPHERDESAASQSGAVDANTRQAHQDVVRGLVDTSRAEATETTYRKNLRSQPQAVPGAPTPPGKQPR